MTIEQPFVANNPQHALSRFVFLRLKERGFAVEEIGELLKVDIDASRAHELDSLEPGRYVLKFDFDAMPADIGSRIGKFKPIHVNIYHPLVKKLAEGLDDIAVHAAEFKYEDELDIPFLLQWFETSFRKIGLGITHYEEVQNKLEAIEVWFELATKAGRGIFPVVLRRGRVGENFWVFDAPFQADHKRRRHNLITDQLLQKLKIVSEPHEHLDEAISTAYQVVRVKLQKAKHGDGGFLRKLRLLRGEEVSLQKNRDQGASNEVIEHIRRRIDQLKAELQAPNEVVVNSIVLLYSTIQISLRVCATTKPGEIKFPVECDWSANRPNEVVFRYIEAGQKQIMPRLKFGKLTEPNPDLGICPRCNAVGFTSDINPVDIPAKSAEIDCIKCRISCVSCNKSMTKDVGKMHSYLNQWLCPIHVRKCSITGATVRPDEVVTLLDGRIVKSDLAGSCQECSTRAGKKVFHLTENLKAHSTRKSWLLCKDHALQCAITHQILTPGEIVKIKDGRLARKDLIVACATCTKIQPVSSDQQMNPNVLKVDAIPHGFDSTRWLCNTHATRCEISGAAVEPEEIIELVSNKRVAIQITEPCYMCTREGIVPDRHVKSLMNPHAYNKKLLCPEHSAFCEVSGLVVTPEELVILESGKKAAVQLTEACVDCERAGIQHPLHMKRDLVAHSFTGKKLCSKHKATCDLSKKIVSISEIVQVASGEHVMQSLARKCVDCNEIPGRNPYLLKSVLVQHRDGIQPDLYSCLDHALYCWKCDEMRPEHRSEKSPEHAPLCEPCKDEWEVPINSAMPAPTCALCVHFSGKTVSPRRDKCPRCGQLSLSARKDELLPAAISDRITGLIKARIYKSVDSTSRLILIAKHRLLRTPKWYVFDQNFLPVATNAPADCPLE